MQITDDDMPVSYFRLRQAGKIGDGTRQVSQVSQIFNIVEDDGESEHQAQGVGLISRAVIEPGQGVQKNTANSQELAATAEIPDHQAAHLNGFVRELADLVGNRQQ